MKKKCLFTLGGTIWFGFSHKEEENTGLQGRSNSECQAGRGLSMKNHPTSPITSPKHSWPMARQHGGLCIPAPASLALEISPSLLPSGMLFQTLQQIIQEHGMSPKSTGRCAGCIASARAQRKQALAEIKMPPG